MIYVGIDVAKEIHYAAAMNSNSVVLLEPFAFNNTADGFCTLLKKIRACLKNQENCEI